MLFGLVMRLLVFYFLVLQMFEVVEGAQGSISAAHHFDPAHKDGLEALAVQGDSLFTAARDSCIKKWDLASKQIQGVST